MGRVTKMMIKNGANDRESHENKAERLWSFLGFIVLLEEAGGSEVENRRQTRTRPQVEMVIVTVEIGEWRAVEWCPKE
jgi:hypothetical protein